MSNRFLGSKEGGLSLATAAGLTPDEAGANGLQKAAELFASIAIPVQERRA
jgi:hypothetical protein